MLDLCCAYVGPCWAPAGRAGAILSVINYVGPMLGQERRVHLGPCTRAQMNMQFLAKWGPCWGFMLGTVTAISRQFGVGWRLEKIPNEKTKTFSYFSFVGIFWGPTWRIHWAILGCVGGHVGAMLGLCVTHVGLMLVHVAPLGAMLGPSWA